MTRESDTDGESGGEDPLRVDPTSLTFDVKRYIRHSYAEVAHLDKFQTLNDAVRREADNAGEELKKLIRENMGTFIAYKETMDTMHANDNSLFTGEALDSITDAFHTALGDGEVLIAPTTDLFEDLRATKVAKETLAKLMAVWRVPGLIYNHCGVRIASRPSDDTRVSDFFCASPGERGEADESSADSDDTDSDAREETGANNRRDAETNAKDLLTRGLLECAADGDEDGFVLRPGEELRYWYGTAIAQLRNPIARRRAVEERSNYEAAVLCLRRAMLYLEENYDLERAVVLGEDESDAEDVSRESAGGTTAGDGENPKLAMTLTCQYAMALLRAALYLNKQLSYELRHANAADTVLIEDTLSAMMDVSIATVKLRHFCWAAGGAAIGRLRRHSAAAATDDEDDAASSGAEEEAERAAEFAKAKPDAWRQFAGTERTGETRTAAHRAGVRVRCRAEHPVEYYVRITRNQHTRLMEASARRARRDAIDWRQKYISGVRPAAANASSTGRATGHGESLFFPESSFTGVTAGEGKAFLGDFGDSFMPAKASEMGMETAGESMDGDTIDDRIRVNIIDAAKGDLSHVLTGADAILEAFRTPEMDFKKCMTFCIGEEDMGVVLECSAAQIVMQSRGILNQIIEHADVEVNVAAHAATVNTFESRLFEACLEHMELVLASYWGGIATAIHVGVFDFNPDASTPFGRMLHGPAALADGASEVPQGRENTRRASVDSNVTPFNNNNNNNNHNHNNNFSSVGMNDGNSTKTDSYPESDALPPLLFVPVVARSAGGPTLRQFSIAAVRRGIRAAGDILHALLLASANRGVVQAFVHTMAAYRKEDLVSSVDRCSGGEDGDDEGSSERAELHAAILVELLLTQWERAVTQVNKAILRMKFVVGGSCTSATMSSNAQAEEVGGILEELEQLRSMLLRCYTHAVGLLAKAYVTLLPSLQLPISVQAASVTAGKRSVASVRARVSRDFVSSVMTNKLLNLLSVVVDRTAPFLQRYDEIFNGVDLFAAKAEGRDKVQPANRGGPTRRARVLRRQQAKESSPQQQQQQQEERELQQEDPDGSADLYFPEEEELDPVTAFMAQCNSRMALEHTSEHEEMFLALIANILLVFVDMLHYRCQRASSLTDASEEAREQVIVESLADALCLPTSVAPIVANELVAPCILSVVAALSTLNNARERDPSPAVARKLEHFRADYLARVDEHCQLVVDAMLGMFLSAPKQVLTREVRRAGFVMPMFDWQRVSAHTAGAVRPYVMDALVHIARAHEFLQLLRQPLLGAAATQHLVAHFAFAFVTALTADGNAFEVSPDCSAAFLVHGLVLLDAEARTVVGIADALASGVAQSPRAGDVLPELRAAREALVNAAAALRTYGSAVCDGLAARRATGEEIFTAKARERRCDAMVAAALARSRYLVQAIITYAEDRTVAAAFAPAAGAAPGKLVERLARRAEGYRPAQTARRAERDNAREEKRARRSQLPAESAKGTGKDEVAREEEGEEEEEEGKQRDEDNISGVSSRSANLGSVLRVAAELTMRAEKEETKASAKERGGKGESATRRDANTRKRTTMGKGRKDRVGGADDNAGPTRRFRRSFVI